MKSYNLTLSVFPSYEEMSKRAALFVFKEFIKKEVKKFVLGLATGSTQIGFRQEFLKLLKKSSLCLKNLYLVNLDEYWPIKKGNPQSYFQEMKQNFWQPLENLKLGFNQKNAFIPNGEGKNPKICALEYEETIKKLGGIDLQMLGVGIEGHIGFNEKGSSLFSKTRLVTLSPSTIEANKRFFLGNKNLVPKKALTMGIATILKAKKILLLANGEKKQAIIKRLIKEPPNKNLPASFLKLHKMVFFFLDKDAYGEKLT